MKQQLLPSDFDFHEKLPLWSCRLDQKSIERHFEFKDFEQAFEFMTLCAKFAEEINHHPDWSNSWNVVMVALTTHSVGGLTNLDVRMAMQMDYLAEQVGRAN
jgi:4a-hydroxytetrahydrobiopterin dehydratase